MTSATLTTVDMTTGVAETVAGEVEALLFDQLPVGDKLVEIWLPHNEAIELADLLTDEPIVASRPTRPIWVHHGSSISQGSNAAHPTGTWPVVAARLAGVELMNLGYGGSALLDPFTARIIRDTPAELISIKIGINLVNADLMRLRAFVPSMHGFLDTIRDGHPATPLLVVSPLLCPIHENTPGPGAFDLESLAEGVLRFRATGDPAEAATGKLTLTVVRTLLADIVAQRASADSSLFYLDGLRLYGPDDADRAAAARSAPPRPRDTSAHRGAVRRPGVRGRRAVLAVPGGLLRSAQAPSVARGGELLILGPRP